MKSVTCQSIRSLLGASTNPAPPEPQFCCALRWPVSGLIALHHAVLWPVSVDEPTYRAATGAVTAPTLPAKPPPPRFCTLPFHAPCTPPAPPSAALSGRPTRILIAWYWVRFTWQ